LKSGRGALRLYGVPRAALRAASPEGGERFGTALQRSLRPTTRVYAFAGAFVSACALHGKPRDADSVKSNIARPRRSRANAVFVDFVTAVQSFQQQ